MSLTKGSTIQNKPRRSVFSLGSVGATSDTGNALYSYQFDWSCRLYAGSGLSTDPYVDAVMEFQRCAGIVSVSIQTEDTIQISGAGAFYIQGIPTETADNLFVLNNIWPELVPDTILPSFSVLADGGSESDTGRQLVSLYFTSWTIDEEDTTLYPVVQIRRLLPQPDVDPDYIGEVEAFASAFPDDWYMGFVTSRPYFTYHLF